ncbi:mitochondrial ribosomal protein subunit-domain-containing protein [Trametes polyzona]|nr:mitochondrial ribosomal protein subunit-domain-containing protein [Trametes polyzona]
MATPPPSQFAALLRRSKFASFDPKIGQVYTAYDGNAARGNFGLKRPLAIRRRNAHITVQAIDSREQQTVWRSAEQENRWIRMWDETGASPTTVSNSGAWATRLGPFGEVEFKVDSDLVPQEGVEADEEGSADGPPAAQLPKSQATRNLDAMSEKEFDWYLRRLRQLRPAFREYLEKYSKEPCPENDSSLLGRSLFAAGNDFKDFLEHRAWLDYHAPRPRYIEQQPHRFAGLSYTRSPPLQTLLILKPHIGRVLSREDSNVLVGTAGMTSVVPRADRSTEVPPVAHFRFTKVELISAPATVGVVPEGLEGVKLKTNARLHSPEMRDKQENPYPPGTKEYIAYAPAVNSDLGMASARPYARATFEPSPKTRDTAARSLLESLNNTITGGRREEEQ